MLLEITCTVLSQIKSILSRFGSVDSMLLAAVAMGCLGAYIFRAVIVVRLFIIYPLSYSPKPLAPWLLR